MQRYFMKKNCLLEFYCIEFNLWTPQILLDSYKNSNNRQRTTQISKQNSFKHYSNDTDESWVIHTPTNINEVRVFSMNSKNVPTVPSDNNVKISLHNQENISKVMFKRPGFQLKWNQINTWSSAFSNREGNKTSKNKEGQYSTETFDEFVVRTKHNNTRKIPQNIYKNKMRPSTSGGYGQMRVKQPGSKSGMGVKLYDEVQKYPYFKYYRQNTQKEMPIKGDNTEYWNSNSINNEVESLQKRRTMLPNSHELLINGITTNHRATEYAK